MQGKILGVRFCQTCTSKNFNLVGCNAKKVQEGLEQPPTPPTPTSSGPAAPLQDGVLEQPQQSPPSLPDIKDNTKQQNDGGILEQPDQGTDDNKKDNAKPPKGDGGGGLDQGTS